MNHTIDIPQSVFAAFPMLNAMARVRTLAAAVPLVPDTTFTIFVAENQDFFALIVTDYPDPYHQNGELKSISGQYEFEFINLITPHAKKGETIEILEQEDMDTSFFVTAPYKTYRLYYYLAPLKYKS